MLRITFGSIIGLAIFYAGGIYTTQDWQWLLSTKDWDSWSRAGIFAVGTIFLIIGIRLGVVLNRFRK